MDPLSGPPEALAFIRADPSDPTIEALIACHTAASRLHYAIEDRHALGGEDLERSGTLLFAALMAGQVVAIGGFRPLGDGNVELKSMFTCEAARGRGVARALLDHIMAHASAEGYRAALLEAGRSDTYAAAARALYRSAGFYECPAFGEYIARDASVFLARAL